MTKRPQSSLDEVLADLHRDLLHLAARVVGVMAETAGVADEPEPWLDLKAGAVYASCSVDTLRQLISSGVLPHGRLGKRAIRVKRSDIDAVMRAAAGGDGGGPQDPVAERAAEILRGLRR